MKKNKINILLFHLDLGGVEKTAVNLANELDELGLDVTITTIYKQHPEKFIINKGVKLKKIFGFYFKGFDRIINKMPKRLLYKCLPREKYDIEVAFQAGLPTSIISSSSNEKSRKYAWVHGIGMKSFDEYHKFDRIFFVGEELKQYYTENLEHIQKEKKQVFHNSIDIVEIKKLASEQQTIIDENVVNLISVGRLSEEKRFDRLLESFSDIIKHENYSNANLTIVGEGPERGNLEKLITSLGIEERIRLVGFDKNPYKYIKNSNIYICSSDYEGFNVALTEAVVLRKPVITTNVFGVEELIDKPSIFGQIVEKDKKSICDALLKYNFEDIESCTYNPVNEKLYSILKSREEKIQEFFVNDYDFTI